MLFAIFAHCTSSREVTASMLRLKWKTRHFQLRHIPYRSPLIDAHRRRSHLVFADVYYLLLHQYSSILSDSRFRYAWESRWKSLIRASSSLFKDISGIMGRKRFSGKNKGSIKVHAQINLRDQLPNLICFSSSPNNHDKAVLEAYSPWKKQKIAVFDKGYNDYKTFAEFTRQRIFFLIRLK